MKNEKNVPFPAPYCIFLRTYLLKMFFGKRGKWHFRDLEFKNILGNMRPDSLFWSAFRALIFLPVRTKSLIVWPWQEGLKLSFWAILSEILNHRSQDLKLVLFIYLLIQGHPTTVFCKICVRRSKYCLEFSFAWGRLKISKWTIHLCSNFEAYLINSLRFSEV